MRLDLSEDVVRDVLAQAAASVGPMIREVLGSPDPVLAELGAICSHGAPRQPLHADTRLAPDDAGGAVLLTAFVALQDVDETMGPTTFLPGTHTDAWAHAALGSPDEKTELLLRRAGPRRRLGTMRAGGCTLYDSRLLHAGGANRCAARAGGDDGEGTAGDDGAGARWLLYAGFCRTRTAARDLRGDLFEELQRGVPTLSDFVHTAANPGT